MYMAMRRADSSDPEDYLPFLGWGRQEALLADVFDAVFENARMTGMWKKPPKPFPAHPARPVIKKKKEPATVKGLFAKFKSGGAVTYGR